MVGSIKDLFLHPDSFFAQVSSEGPGLFWPFVVVSLGSIINFVGAVILSPAATDPLPQYSITFLLLFGVSLFTWILISSGLYLLSRAYSGTGSILMTLQNTGYGMMPFVFLGMLNFSSIAVITGNAASLSLIPPMIFTFLIYVEQLFFTIWTGYLWICGVRHAHKLPTPLAAAVVVIVVAISLAVFIILTTIPLP